MPRLEAEVAGKSAAPAVQALDVEPHRLEQRSVCLKAEHGVLMAVRLDERAHRGCAGAEQGFGTRRWAPAVRRHVTARGRGGARRNPAYGR